MMLALIPRVLQGRNSLCVSFTDQQQNSVLVSVPGERFQQTFLLPLSLCLAPLYTPKVFSALKTQVLQQAKRRLVYTKRLVFKGQRRKIHIHQTGFKVFVGTPSRSIGI